MRTTSIRSVLLFAFLLMVGISGFAHAADITLGALIPLTGFATGFGENQKIGLDIAVDEINKAGGIKGNTLKMITYNKYQIISISASAAKPGLAEAHRPYGFINATSDMNTLPPAVEYWVKAHNIKTVCIVTDIKDALNKSTGQIVFPKLLEAKGVKILGTSEFVTGEMDLSAHVSKFKGVNPDGIVVSCTIADAAGFIKEAKKQGMDKPFIGGVAIQAPKFLELAGADANGTITGSSFWVENLAPKSIAFVEEFKKRYGGREPNPFAANMHENVFIIKKLIETTGVTNKPSDLDVDRQKIQKGLEVLKNFEGVTGTFSVTKEGTVDKSGYVLMAKDGKWVKP